MGIIRRVIASIFVIVTIPELFWPMIADVLTRPAKSLYAASV